MKDGKFEIGDVVKLKSESDHTPMTVEFTDVKSGSGNEVIACAWFVDRELKRNAFPVEMLQFLR